MGEWLPKDNVCIVGVGETEYTKHGQIKRSEFQLACEAILNAVDDAGLKIQDIDGICSFSNDRNDPTLLATALGIPQLRFSNMVWGGGGGGGCGAVGNAAMAVYTGAAKYVVAFRALAQGQFVRFGQAAAAADFGANGFNMPYGVIAPVQIFAMHARRHMHEYGTTSRQFGAVSVACYKHAQRNPRAVMYGRPITIEDHQNSRMIADPLRLYDCCLESDGAAAVVVTTADRAKDLKQRPVYLMAAAQGTGPGQGDFASVNRPDYPSSNFKTIADDLWKMAGITPNDIDVAQIYETFTCMVLMTIEDHGFCKKGEGGAFVENGRIEWPDGELPINTSGGNLAEAYIHGFELINEAVRQMRGTSTCQVKDAETCLVASGPASGTVTNLIVRR